MEEKKLTAKEKKVIWMKKTVTRFELTRAKKNFDLARGTDKGNEFYITQYRMPNNPHTHMYLNGKIDIYHYIHLLNIPQPQPVVTDEVPTMPEMEEMAKSADGLLAKFKKWLGK